MGPRQYQHDPIAPRSAKFGLALALLAEAASYSEQTSNDLWEFAVEIHYLRELGLSKNDLRFLVRLNYLQHAREITRIGDDGRQFQPTGDLSFSDRTCFVLTAKGAAAAACAGIGEQHTSRALHPATIPIPHSDTSGFTSGTPSWNAERRILLFEGCLVKRFRCQAVNQELILSAFEEEGWPGRIDDPLAPIETLDIKRRLNDTIKSLNRSQHSPLIHFRGDGTGEGVVWEPV